jgi:fucose permease
MVLVSGAIADRLGVRGILIGGSILASLALVALAFAESYRAAALGLVAAGAGASCLMTGAMVLMPKAFFEENPSASINLGNVFIGFGALVTPALADVLVRGMRLRPTLNLLALLALLPTAAVIFTGPEAYPSRAHSSADLLLTLSDPAVWLTGLVFAFYNPLEGVLGTWATTYLTEIGDKPQRASLFLSGFWLTFLGSRLLVSWLQQREILPENSDPWLIVFLSVTTAVILGNMAGTKDQAVGRRCLLLAGGCLGPVFPTLVGVVFEHTRPSLHGTAYGAMFAIGSTGSLALPPVIGAYARRTCVRNAFRLAMLVALLLAAVALVLSLSL